MSDYDWHFDRDGDGRLDAHERYERDDFNDYLAKRNYYAEDSHYSSGRSGGHPLYWGIVWTLVIIIALLCPSSPGIPLFILALAFSFSFCL